MARYLVGIDLGTTNSALAYVDSNAKGKRGVKLHGFDVPQLVGPGQMGSPSLLPSFLYLPGPHDLAPESIALPWNKEASEVVGKFARNHGSKIPGRLVSSAKSWLCHPGVDRTAPLLPWGGSDDVHKISPLDASAKYIRHLIEAWNNSPNRKPEEYLEEQQVVLTVPASFDDMARNLTSDAAKHAGLKHFTLLEEPQAAFYAWLGTHSPKEAGKLKPGMRCVVVDVGGGTTDFSLIRAGEEQGELTFVRDAVGDHLLLGGDNMDLALAKSIEAKLPGGRLDAAQFGGLIQACRQAKEALLGDDPPKSFPVTVVGKGRSVVGGTISKNVTRDDIEAVLFDGFFPEVPYNADPQRPARSGLQEMGLPYVADAAITKHLAAFLRQHIPDGEAPDAILFNGGVFTPKPLQERIVAVMKAWFGDDWEPLQLTSPSLDLAVAWGAAYQCWLKQSGGRRIGGGIPRSYYIGIATEKELPPEQRSIVCIVPRRLEEGEEIELDGTDARTATRRACAVPTLHVYGSWRRHAGRGAACRGIAVGRASAIAHDVTRRQTFRQEASPRHSRRESDRDRHAGTLLRLRREESLAARIQRPRRDPHRVGQRRSLGQGRIRHRRCIARRAGSRCD